MRSADGEANPAAIAEMAGMHDGVSGWQARCLSEKRARNRFASGSDSVVMVLRRETRIGSVERSPFAGEVADGAIFVQVWCEVFFELDVRICV